MIPKIIKPFSKFDNFQFKFRYLAHLRGRYDFRRKTVLRIGGNLNRVMDVWVKDAKETIDVNIADDYLGQKTNATIRADAHHLPMLQNEKADAVVSSHTIEHLTNPIKALKEWNRILRPGGLIYACVPYYKKTFDHRRNITSFEHLLEDYEKNTGLDDKTHDEEFTANYDVRRDLVFKDRESWYKNYVSNPALYTHFHVFNKELVLKMMSFAGFECEKLFYFRIGIEYFGKKPEK